MCLTTLSLILPSRHQFSHWHIQLHPSNNFVFPTVSLQPFPPFATRVFGGPRLDEVSAFGVIDERATSLTRLERLDGVFSALLLQGAEVALVVVAGEVAKEQSRTGKQLIEVVQEAGCPVAHVLHRALRLVRQPVSELRETRHLLRALETLGASDVR